VPALGSVSFGVSDSDDDSQEEEDDADEGLVLVDVLASDSGTVGVAIFDVDRDDGLGDLAACLSSRARLKAAMAAASLGVDEPSSLSSAGEAGDALSGCV